MLGGGSSGLQALAGSRPVLSGRSWVAPEELPGEAGSSRSQHGRQL